MNQSAKNRVDASVEIMLATDAPNFEYGDVIEIYRTSRLAKVIWNEADQEYKTTGGVKFRRTGYIHVQNIPQDMFRRLRRIRKQKYAPDISGGENPHSGGLLRRRRWQVQIDELADGPRNKLLNQRELTRTWVQFKNKTKHVFRDEYLTDAFVDDDLDPDP